MKYSCLSAAVIAAMAGQALAQYDVDGVAGGSELPYPVRWIQNQPTSFGDNVAGSVGTGQTGAGVNTGLEIQIELVSLGLTSMPAGGIKFGCFMDSISNQVLSVPPLACDAAPLGLGRNVNFNTIAGNQFVVLNPPVSGVAPLLDGTGDLAGAEVWVNETYTANTNRTQGVANDATGGGNEMDRITSYVYNNGTAGDTSDDKLYIFIAGNFSDNRRIGMFFDAAAGGQNRILNGMPDLGFTDWDQRIKELSAGSGDGLTWDAAFEPELLIVGNAGQGPPSNFYFDGVTLPTGAGGTAGYLGLTNNGGPSIPADGSLGVFNGGQFQAMWDNSNVDGVEGAPCGQSVIPSRDFADGSELDSLRATIDNNGTPGDFTDDVLRLLIAGNLQTNFNKLSLFFDVDPAEGQNQLLGNPSNPLSDFNGLNRLGAGGNGAVGAGPGLKFDACMFPDYWISVGNGNNPVQMFINAAVLRANGANNVSSFQTDFSAFDGGDKPVGFPHVLFPGTYAECQQAIVGDDPPNTDAGPRQTYTDNESNILVCDTTPGSEHLMVSPVLIPNAITGAIDNNNVGGVTGSDAPDVSLAAEVTTGIEISIRVAELGWDGVTPIKIAGLLHNAGYDFASNQVLGGIGDGSSFVLTDLGETTLIDFSLMDGRQYVVVTADDCDDIDFNGDCVFPDVTDLFDFLTVFSGGACPSGTCGDIDINNDLLFPDTTDLFLFLDLFGGSPCPSNQ